ncbi:hypothetical protein EVAR_94252_1 [Eumeta japonica]|uniref:Uncharacterized protein n=1 Tax=Eumeta variegata TaxID=151549 RepID=A0A4C1UN29_EUMVA|nr:hypothetical protein EVAR_94252_1 [Eumeta japonica]
MSKRFKVELLRPTTPARRRRTKRAAFVSAPTRSPCGPIKTLSIYHRAKETGSRDRAIKLRLELVKGHFKRHIRSALVLYAVMGAVTISKQPPSTKRNNISYLALCDFKALTYEQTDVLINGRWRCDEALCGSLDGRSRDHRAGRLFLF